MENSSLKLTNAAIATVITDLNTNSETEEFFEKLLNVPIGEFGDYLKKEFDIMFSDVEPELKAMKTKDFLEMVFIKDIEPD